MNKKCILFLLIFLAYSKTWGHQDFYVTYIINETSLRIETGFDFEEINKASLVCNLIDDLRDQYNYCKPIYIDFFHDYTGAGSKIKFLNIGKPKIIIKSEVDDVSSAAFDKEIIIRVIDEQLPTLEVMKLAEYAIKNEDLIKNEQTQYSYQGLWRDWIVYSINQDKIIEIEKGGASDQINYVNDIAYYLPNPKGFTGYSYYLKGGKYYIYYAYRGKLSKIITTVDNLFQIKAIGGRDVIIFENKSSFQYYKNNAKEKSKKHSIVFGHDSFRPYDCLDLGGDKVLIRYRVFTDNQRDYNPGREMLYIVDLDKVIDDFDTFIRKHK